ncbi:MAG: type II toxin-antitoxin system RelE/ParE family toxin [Pyrinomonadaceae bacterium]
MEFIETIIFTRRIRELLTDDEYSRLQATLIETPDLGDIIKGSGGLRKIRWAARGRGKSGGLRVIYYWVTEESLIYMLSVYAKSVKGDLTRQEIKALRRFLDEALI